MDPSLVLFIAGIPTAQSQSANSSPARVNRVGTTEKVCQLTADTERETGRPTAAKTFSNFGLDACDLGYPVEHDGKLILLFRDSWPPPHGGAAAGEVPPDDAVGVRYISICRFEMSWGSLPLTSITGSTTKRCLITARPRFGPAP